MKTFQRLMAFSTTLTKLAAQTHYYDFSKTYKVGRIHIAYSNMEKLVKEEPIQLELLTPRQLKILQFDYSIQNGLYIIPLYLRHLLPENLYVYEKYTKEKGLITDFANLNKVGVIPYSIEYKPEGLSEGFFFYLRHGYFPDDT